MLVSYLKRIGFLLLDIIAFAFIFLVIAIGLTYIVQYFMDQKVDDQEMMNDPIILLMTYIPLTIAALVATYLTHSKIFQRSFHLTGIVRKSILKDYSKGLILGVVLITFGFLILRLLGYLDILDYNFAYSTILLFFVFFIFQSFFEEVAFRSYLMPAVENRLGLWAALIISSILFAAIHLTNSNINALGTINILLAGLLLGVLFVKYDNVWVASGFHCSWNYVQSTIFGFEVSGERLFSMMETEEVGPDILTGGAFGFEGSLLSVLFVGGLFLYYVLKDDYVRLRLSGSDMAESSDVDYEIV